MIEEPAPPPSPVRSNVEIIEVNGGFFITTTVPIAPNVVGKEMAVARGLSELVALLGDFYTERKLAFRKDPTVN